MEVGGGRGVRRQQCARPTPPHRVPSGLRPVPIHRVDPALVLVSRLSSLFLVAWDAHARTLYLQSLREALVISRDAPLRSSPPRAAKKQKLAPTGGMLFRGAQLKPSPADSPVPAATATNDSDFDPVLDELRRWEGMGLQEYEKFMDADGLLNEFALMWSVRKSFPLHYIVFKQTACHLAHEAGVEQIFSRAGLLADPNLDPAHLVALVKIGFNKAVCWPSVEAIKNKYYELFRGRGAIEDDDLEDE